MKRYLFSLSLCLALAPGGAAALESDRDQPAIIDADTVDIDFNAGIRIYEGNVKLRQGTIRLDADRLEVRFKDDALESAIAVGSPAEFRQRPEGKDHDVVGVALNIHLDEVNDEITLTDEAVVTQGRDSIAGKTIVYNMATEKVQVRSGGTGQTRTTKSAEESGQSSSEPAPAAAEAESPAPETAADGEARRPRIILKPKAAE